jgi:hypothetical protein
MSSKKFNFDYSNDNDKSFEKKTNDFNINYKNNEIVDETNNTEKKFKKNINTFNEDRVKETFTLNNNIKFNIDIGSNLRKAKSSRFNENDYNKKGENNNKQNYDINFTKYNDYTLNSDNLLTSNLMNENYSNF